MDRTIRIGICGYGNLGRGVELAVAQSNDMTVRGVFTRREASTINTVFEDTKVYSINELVAMKDEIDVLILCGGSATDLVVQSPEYATSFNIVDSFDNHGMIPEHFALVNEAAKYSGKTAIISAGWDPGLFSINRLIGESVLPKGETYTFWGKGVSQGHSDAIRRINGVVNAVQYTIPIEEAFEQVRSGQNPNLSPREKHLRQCFVVAANDANLETIREEIVTMPNYFEPYDTEVNFISIEEFERDHRGMPHGGNVIRSGKTGVDTNQIYEFTLNLESNPEFTSSVLVAYARACFKMALEGQTGAKTVLEIPPYMLSDRSLSQLRAELL
ncbi:MAG: diaminopimelate dehydrogenase [Anaerovoracaceae bacterium]